MKLFSGFRSCCRSAAVSPVATDRRRTEEHGGKLGRDVEGGGPVRRLAKVKYSGGGMTHWRPKLAAIAEDGPIPEVDRGAVNRRTAGDYERTRAVRGRSKSAAKATPPQWSHAEEYWNSCQTTTVPGFSPMSFLF